MQYYIHAHGFGTGNRKCLKILLKGLRQIELPLDIHETPLPSPFTARPDNTRVSTGFGSSTRSVPGRFPTQASTARGPIHTAADPNSAYWHTITTGHRVTLSPQIVIQKVGELGHNQRDYFVFANHQMAEVSLASRHVSWSTFTNLPEINYFKYGRYTMPGADGDGIDNMEQLKRAVLASKEFMPAEIGSRFEELVTPQALAVMATFGTVYVASQLTPVGWAADALVAVLVVGSCWMLGSELSEVARLFKAFYDTAINAGNNPAKYREAGHYLAQAVSKVGVDVVLGILLHKASVPLQRKLVNMRQSVSVERPVSAVEEPVSKEKAPVVETDKKVPGSELEEGVMGRRAASRGYTNIKTTKNGGPTFKDSSYLYPESSGVKNVVKIKLKGSRYQDFKEANKQAGIAGSEAPDGYTWHHVDDFNLLTGESTMELVETNAHKATIPHKGSVYQYEQYHGVKYK